MPILHPAEISGRNRRRSQRIQHKNAVMVRFRDDDKNSISEKTETMTVNDHGGLILLAATVKTQQIIHLENLNTGEELLCRVASLGQTLMGKTQVAVEFITPKPGFWNTLPKPKPLGTLSKVKK